jgi:hypothetical protein
MTDPYRKRSQLDKSFESWTKKNQVQDLDQKKAALHIFEAGWNARGNPWVHLFAIIFLLAFLAYFVTLIDTH